MDEQINKLSADTTGLLNYEFLANNIGSCDEYLPTIVDNIVKLDTDGQFTVSAARYLNAIDGKTYKPYIDTLVAAAIGKDRDRKYIGALLACLWGEDYAERADELNATDDNFRRIYKRVYPTGI